MRDPSPHEPLVILCVDDDHDIALLPKLSLERDDAITARTAASGDEALRVLSAGWKPDCILLDFRMPDADGAQVLLAVRRIPGLQDMPVIFLTAAPKDVRAASKDDHVIGTIAKPFDPIALPSIVRSYLARR